MAIEERPTPKAAEWTLMTIVGLIVFAVTWASLAEIDRVVTAEGRLVTTSSKNFDRVKAIIMDLDRAVPQVLIKVLIAEVTHDNSLDLGVEFSGMNLSTNATGTILRGLPGSTTDNRGFKTGSDFKVPADIAAKGGYLFRLDEKYVQAAIHALASTNKASDLRS